MELELLNASVVVLAQEHNPTILHPAFLAAQGIVPREWECGEPPICTPAFSIVKYKTGITFTVEGNRLVVTEEKPAGNPDESEVPKLALAYVQKLPHVRYRALGVNFAGCCLREDPERFLIETFLKAGPWNDETRPMKALGARFVYQLEDAILRMGLDGGQVSREGESASAILVNGNYHSEFPSEKPVDALCDFLGRWAELLGDFTSLSRLILGMEESQ